MSHISDRIYPITRGEITSENPPLVVLRDSNDNNHIIAARMPPTGEDVKNTFANKEKPRTKNAEKKLFQEDGLDLDKIDPNAHYRGGVAHKKSAKRRRASRKTNKRRSSKKQNSHRNKKSKHTK
jgi:hypothetical protein